MPTRPRLKSNKKLITRNNKRLTPGFKFRVSGFKFARGQILILALAFLTIILILSASLFGKITNYVRFGKVNTDTQQATFLAEAGVDYAVWKFNQGLNPTITALPLGTGQIDISWVTQGAQRKLTSKACLPTSNNCKIKRIVEILAQEGAQTFPIENALHLDRDNLDLGDSNDAPVINGNVFLNSTVSGGALGIRITGNLRTSQDHPDATWNALCAVQVGGTECQDGGNPWWIQNQALTEPTFEEQEVKTAAAANIMNVNSLPLSTNCTLQNKTFYFGPTKFIGGDLSFVGGGGRRCTLMLRGPIWVADGRLILTATDVIPDDAFLGSASTVVIVDNQILSASTTNWKKSLQGGYTLAWSTLNSQQTSLNAIENGVGNGAILYAPNGIVATSGSNNINVRAIVANGLKTRFTSGVNSSQITYESGVASAVYRVGTGTSSSWVLLKGSYYYK